jgi:hypothetical protein
MPDYDEYGIAYKDRSALFSKTNSSAQMANKKFPHVFIIDGKVAGSWKSSTDKDSVVVDILPFTKLPIQRDRALQKAIKDYCAFRNNGKRFK